MSVAAAAPIAVKSATGVLTAAGVWSGVIALLLICVLAYIKIIPRLKELENTNNAGIRREFIDEMAALREEVVQLRTENAQLRAEVRELHNAMDGMRRQNLQEGASAAGAILAALPEAAIPPATAAALRRVRGEK